MLTVSKRNWWVRLAMMANNSTSDALNWGRPVSVCALFWTGMFVLTMLTFVTVVFVGSPITLYLALSEAAWLKEAAVVMAIVAAIIGLLVWRERVVSKTDKDFVPPIVSTTFWAIKNRVCPMVRVK